MISISITFREISLSDFVVITYSQGAKSSYIGRPMGPGLKPIGYCKDIFFKVTTTSSLWETVGKMIRKFHTSYSRKCTDQISIIPIAWILFGTESEVLNLPELLILGQYFIWNCSIHWLLVNNPNQEIFTNVELTWVGIGGPVNDKFPAHSIQCSLIQWFFNL